MKLLSDIERYFEISDFEEGWGMELVSCEEQLFEYCVEALCIPEEKIEDVSMSITDTLEILLHNLEGEDIAEDWYLNIKVYQRKTDKYYA